MNAQHGGFDYCVVGGGIIGLATARALISQNPSLKICIIEKERDVAEHASGRNSGVLHAGFYYSPDSMKARLTRDGNKALRRYCIEEKLPLNTCGKLVVASDSLELERLLKLKERGDKNGVDLSLITEAEAKKVDPQARTYDAALFSPTTASIDPISVCMRLKNSLMESGVQFKLATRFLGFYETTVTTTAGSFECGYLINCAGLYADKIARSMGLAKHLTILPFKGVYLKMNPGGSFITTNIYPVPDPAFPFLGVHFTVTSDGTVKIGPTAIPALWRENYGGLGRLKIGELAECLYYQARLFLRNSFGFRDLALAEVRKYRRSYLTNLAAKMVQSMIGATFNDWSRPGIRAQLLNTKTMTLMDDFAIEKGPRSLHVLNAVSPAFTCSFPIADWILSEIDQTAN